jgi:hypothetical protein
MIKWRTLLEQSLIDCGETMGDIVSYAPVDGKWLDYYFDDDSKQIEGESFTVWTKKRVYFPVQYNGSEWVESVSRIPDGKPTNHIGG